MAVIGDKVQVEYRLKLDDGTEYANTKTLGEPFVFTLGSGVMLPDFEQVVLGLEVGESRSIHVPVDRAYGQRDESLVISVPATTLPDGQQVPEGSTIGLNTPEGVMRVKVLIVGKDEMTIDCNHELAGYDLDFDITLVGIEQESCVEHELHGAGCTCGCDRLQQSLAGN